MHPILRKDIVHEVDGAARCNPRPHLPISGVGKPTIELSDLVIRLSADCDGGWTDTIRHGQCLDSVAPHAPSLHLATRDLRTLTVVVNVHATADHSHAVGLPEDLLVACVEAVQDTIVGMQDMHEPTLAETETSIEGTDRSAPLLKVFDSESWMAETTHEFFGMVVGAVVYDHDLDIATPI